MKVPFFFIITIICCSISFGQGSYEININDGMTYMNEGEYYKALESYSKAIQADKNAAEAYYSRGVAKFKLDLFINNLFYFFELLSLL